MRKVIIFLIVIVIVVLIAVAHKRKQADRQDSASPSDVVASVDTPDSWSNSARDHRGAGTNVAAARATWPPLREGTAASPTNTVNYYIVFDGSGSMMQKECSGGTSKIEAAVDAVKEFVAAVPATANIGLTAFDRRAISERVALGIGNRDALVAALQTIHAGSGTPLKSSIKIGYDKLTDQARAQLGYGEYHLIVVTDGKPEPHSEDPTPIVQEILAKSPVILHTIGFCINEHHVLNQQGRTYYASATNPQELQQSLQAVLAEAPVFDAAKFQ